MSLTFFYAPQSSASPTHWILEELGVPYEKVLVDIAKGDQKKPSFLELNPNGKVPVLSHDGTTVFESVAIALYLGETFGVERGLFPAAGPDRAKAFQWLVWCNVSLGEALSRFAHNTSERFPSDQKNEKAGAAAKEEVQRLLSILDSALNGKTALIGGKFSIVDAHLASWAGYVGMLGVDISKYAAIGAWLKAVSARPAFARSHGPG